MDAMQYLWTYIELFSDIIVWLWVSVGFNAEYLGLLVLEQFKYCRLVPLSVSQNLLSKYQNKNHIVIWKSQ